MERKATALFLLGLLFVSVLPLAVHAEESGGVQSSAVQMSLSPSNPVMGGSVDVSVMLYNSQQSDAFNVEVAFYKENIAANNRLLLDQVTVPAEDWYTVSTTWSGLTEGVHKVWFEFSAGGDTQARFNKEFTVAGLPNLRIDTLELNATSPVYAGDTVGLSALVLNSGTVDAPASKLLLEVPESSDVLLDTPALTAGSSAWVNTTIVAPSAGVHAVKVTPDIENVIEEVDQPSDVGLPEVIPLKYANAVELSEEINILLARAGARVSLPRPSTELTAEGFSASGDSSSGISISGPDTGGTSQDLNFPWQTGGNDDEQAAESALIGKVRVVPIIRQNALAVLAPPAYRDSMVRLIHTFDRPRRQVMLAATIVEVELGDNLNLGAKWGQGISQSGQGVMTSEFSIAGAPNGATPPVTDLSNPLQYFWDAITSQGTNAVISAGPFDVNLIVEALNTITNTRILQEPRVYTADNEEAVFFSGLEYPVVSSITDSASAGLNTQTSVEYKNVGVFLNVRPRITEEGAVDLTVTLELSAVGPSASISASADGNVNSQIFTRKQVSSHVILLDGQTVVIGGLLKESESVLKTKVPFLGDLPLIGGLFTHSEDQLERTELIAFLTPTVVHRPFDNYSNFNVDDLQRLEDVARPLQDQLLDDQNLIDLDVFSRITKKATVVVPDQSPLETDIDRGASETANERATQLLRKITPEDDDDR